MFAHAFVRNAYLAGTFIALASGFVGWFVVARAQLFAGDALSHVAFVGAIAAAVVGVDERVGLFALTLAVAAGLASLGERGRQDDAAIGTVFAWILGIGVLLIAVLAASEGGGAGVTRPLLLATIDAEQAAARGVPVKLLGLGILLALAAVTAEGTQAVGALLILGLLSAPAGAAHRLTANPYAGVTISSLIAVAATWGGLALSYEISSLPPSSAIIGLAAAAFALASLISRR
jgi:zinc/manganese transport system permease protein